MDKYEILKNYFGYDRFKPGQEAVIDRLAAGGDALCVMPTGAGKSLCYQIPALMGSGLTLVISPLISLMRDQADALIGAGVPAAAIHSGLDAAQYRQALSGVADGTCRIVFAAPERLGAADFRAAVRRRDVTLVAVDEAHCVSQWGQDFRPSYLGIPDFIESLPFRPAVGAFTATATRRVGEDIERLLRLRDPLRITTGFDRPNLYFAVLQPQDKERELLSLVRQRASRSGIVYCSTRKTVDEVTAFLRAAGIDAARYHAGLGDAERMRSQEDFLFDRRRVMVATNAFGMGIDKSNVGYVIHYQMPLDVETYYQEAGRAGRDGGQADCILLYAPRDVRTARYLVEHGEENTALDEDTRAALRERAQQRLAAMVRYCKTTDCLRAYILRYFGQEASDYCGNCANCEGGFETEDITLDAQKIISCVVRSGQKYGAGMLTDLLRGADTERIRSLGLDSISAYGIMEGREPGEIRRLIEELIAQDVLRRRGTAMPVIGLAPRAAAVIREGEKVERKRPKREKASEQPQDEALFEALYQARARLAMRMSTRPYLIFSDETLRQICARVPRTREALAEIPGVGRYRANQYGKAILDAIGKTRIGREEDPLPSGRAAAREWSEEEDTLLRIEVEQGMRATQIARDHKRTTRQIVERIRQLGLVEE